MSDSLNYILKISGKRILISSFILLITTLTTSSFANEKGRAKSEGVAVEVGSAKLQDVSPATWLPGDLISLADSRIATEVSGQLLSIAEVGQRVKKGDVLASLNDRLLLLNLKDNLTNVNRLKAQSSYLSRQTSRGKRLLEKNGSSQSELERLEMELDISRQELAAAEIQVERTSYLVDQSRITAPFDGVVVERLVQPGEYLSEGQALLRLVNVDEQEIALHAPIRFYDNLTKGSRVLIQAAQSQSTPLPKLGIIDRIIPVGDTRSRMMEIRVKPDSADWVIGQAVKVQLPNGAAKTLLTVPLDALVLRQNQIFVYTVDLEGKAVRVPVSLGASVGDYIVVEGDVADGDTVITRGAERVRPGQQVRSIN